MRSFIMKTASALAVAALVSGSAKAQTCLGRPFFSTGPIQVGAGANATSGERAVGADVTIGRDQSVFGRMGIAHASQSRDALGPSRAGTEMNGAIGYQVNMNTGGHAQLCPYASYDKRGLDADSFTPERTFSQSEMNVGASMGWILPSKTEVHVVPFAGVGYARTSGTVRQGSTTQQYPAHDYYVPGTIGTGVHFGDRYMLTGQAMIPFGSKTADPVFRASVILPTGRNR